ncbi:elongation factor 1-alpha, partial [Tanacetum coccineum]
WLLQHSWSPAPQARAERERGITIDIGEGNFETPHYYFTVLNALGQHDYIKNMISGTLQSDCVLFLFWTTDLRLACQYMDRHGNTSFSLPDLV